MPCPQYMCIYMQREASCFLLLFNPMTLIPSGGPHLRVQCAMLSCFSCVQIFAISWTVARQAPLSMRCSRQEYWSGLPCPPPGDLPNAVIEPASLTSSASLDKFFTSSATWEAPWPHLNLITSQRPHIQRSLYRKLMLQNIVLRGHKNSVHDTWPRTFPFIQIK